MYVYACTCMYSIHVYVCIHVCMCILYVHVCTVYMYVCMYVCTCMYVRSTYVCMYICMYLHVYVCMYVCMNVCIYVYVYMYIKHYISCHIFVLDKSVMILMTLFYTTMYVYLFFIYRGIALRRSSMSWEWRTSVKYLRKMKIVPVIILSPQIGI